ncbi:MAG TPA: CBS domain-containing protein [Thiohalobacter sp.]|nr:CBS domain-containing protein [Thiohalobacter sp.]
MKTIKQLLQDKGSQVWTIQPLASVYDAIYLMADKEIGSLLVVEHERIVGLLSERDYARKVILKGRSSKSTRVSDIMSHRVLYTHGGLTIHEAMAVMTKHRIRHLPVLEDGRLLGIVSMGDLVNAVIAEQQFIIEQLEHYITG